mmetsp:Transcript_26138/g.85950  ORF Transcript_26138/g.85950 Transcript_26138/m.85950 type:complete len:524 (-) Transcript_26138:520-2091(-)
MRWGSASPSSSACMWIASASRSIHVPVFAMAATHMGGRSVLNAPRNKHANKRCPLQVREVHGPNPLPPRPEIIHDMVHFKVTPNRHSLGVKKVSTGEKDVWDNPFQHSVWSEEEIYAVQKTHVDPKDTADSIAYRAVQTARWMFDTLSGYKIGQLTESKVINRAIFLETVAGVPGMVGGMLRHLRSLRTMTRDHGWIHTLLEEAENERMHLLTFVTIKKPGPIFRWAVLGTQGVFMNLFFVTYLIYPKICHRFVGYLEEEAVKTYTDILNAIDDGRLSSFRNARAPQIAIDYWHMKPDATMRDLFLVVRADEANHRDVNHMFASLGLHETNPLVKKSSAKKRELVDRKQEHKQFVKEVLLNWNKSGTGSLSYDELRQWLSSISKGRDVSDHEVKWVMSMAAASKKQDYTLLSLEPEYFTTAAEAWLSYNESRDVIDEVFEKHDVDKDGSLNRDQLKTLLMELNDNIMPTDEEVKWVLDHADVIGDGVIDKPELMKAISLWYVHIASDEAGDEQRATSAIGYGS